MTNQTYVQSGASAQFRFGGRFRAVSRAPASGSIAPSRPSPADQAAGGRCRPAAAQPQRQGRDADGGRRAAAVLTCAMESGPDRFGVICCRFGRDRLSTNVRFASIPTVNSGLWDLSRCARSKSQRHSKAIRRPSASIRIRALGVRAIPRAEMNHVSRCKLRKQQLSGRSAIAPRYCSRCSGQILS
jgi:hypothetical protein